MRVLVVESDRLLGLRLERLLRSHGHAVGGPVATAGAALATLHDSLPDLALLDVRLEGGVDGISLAAMLRERWKIPSIFLTADRNARTRIRGIGLGLIAKPYVPAMVVDALAWTEARSGSQPVIDPPGGLDLLELGAPLLRSAA